MATKPIPTKSTKAGTAAALSVTPSPGWTRAMPPGPDARVKFTEEYARHVARDVYFWAWPLVNMYTRRLFFATIKEMAYVGPLPQCPLNTFAI